MSRSVNEGRVRKPEPQVDLENELLRRLEEQRRRERELFERLEQLKSRRLAVPRLVEVQTSPWRRVLPKPLPMPQPIKPLESKRRREVPA